MIKYLLFTGLLISTFGSTFAQPTNGLISKYSFTNGSLEDEVSNNDAQNFAALTTSDRFGNLNNAFQFTSGYLKIPHDVSIDLDYMDGISISAWIYIDSTASSLQAIVTKWNNNTTSEQYGLFLNQLNNTVAIRTVNNFGLTDNATYSLNSWHHVVFSFDKTTKTHSIYVDNINTMNQTTGGTYSNCVDTTSLSIGAQASDLNSGQDSPYRFFYGKIDDVRIYNRVLSETEIESLYNEVDPAIAGINNKEIENYLFYPNPVKDKLHFDNNTTVQICDVSGIVLIEAFDTKIIDVAFLNSGVYFINFYNSSGQFISSNKILK